jgi:iron complex transport system ATP-binding protein
MTSAGGYELRNVSLAYGDRLVLDEIDLAIGRGERVAILGPNGAGKSTLLRCLTGSTPERRGSIFLDGVPLEELDRQTVARRVAVVPQGVTVPFSMRVADVVELGRIPHEHPFLGPGDLDRAAAAGAMERVGIAGLSGRDARALSMGERQLVLLAMAVAQSTDTLILDEPTVHLDLRHQVAVMEVLRELNERDGATVIAVLHDLGLARAYFPRLILLDAGRVAADGSPDEVLTPAAIRTVYGIDPTALPWLVNVAG